MSYLLAQCVSKSNPWKWLSVSEFAESTNNRDHNNAMVLYLYLRRVFHTLNSNNQSRAKEVWGAKMLPIALG